MAAKKEPIKEMTNELGMPPELLMDLLVDAELPEAERAAFLCSMENDPAQWRELAVRFLQRQTEKESIRQLMDGGRIIPVSLDMPAPGRRLSLGWVGSPRMLAVAAGVLIAAMSALITLYAVRPGLVQPTNLAVGKVGSGGEFRAMIPGDAVDFDRSVPVTVPVIKMENDAEMPFSVASDTEGKSSRRSLVIQPDGNGGAMVIQVNTLKNVKVY